MDGKAELEPKFVHTLKDKVLTLEAWVGEFLEAQEFVHSLQARVRTLEEWIERVKEAHVSSDDSSEEEEEEDGELVAIPLTEIKDPDGWCCQFPRRETCTLTNV